MFGKKRSHCFFLTVNHIEWSKTALGEWLLAADLCEEFAVVEENYHPPLDAETGEVAPTAPARHHHIYLKFKEGYWFTEVQDYK